MTPALIVLSRDVTLVEQLRARLADRFTLIVADPLENGQTPAVAPLSALVERLQVSEGAALALAAAGLPTTWPAADPAGNGNGHATAGNGNGNGNGNGHKRPVTLEARVDEAERSIIEETLRRNNFHRTQSARELGISRVTLYNKMKKFGMLK